MSRAAGRLDGVGVQRDAPWQASVALARPLAISAIGWMVPTSLFASITLTSTVRGGHRPATSARVDRP